MKSPEAHRYRWTSGKAPWREWYEMWPHGGLWDFRVTLQLEMKHCLGWTSGTSCVSWFLLWKEGEGCEHAYRDVRSLREKNKPDPWWESISRQIHEFHHELQGGSNNPLPQPFLRHWWVLEILMAQVCLGDWGRSGEEIRHFSWVVGSLFILHISMFLNVSLDKITT